MKSGNPLSVFFSYSRKVPRRYRARESCTRCRGRDALPGTPPPPPAPASVECKCHCLSLIRTRNGRPLFSTTTTRTRNGRPLFSTTTTTTTTTKYEYSGSKRLGFDRNGQTKLGRRAGTARRSSTAAARACAAGSISFAQVMFPLYRTAFTYRSISRP